MQLGGGFVTLDTAGDPALARRVAERHGARPLRAISTRSRSAILSHDDLEAWADAAEIPVINALTSVEHPCQALADALTIRERLGTLDGVRVAWVGDGTNVLVSLAHLGEADRDARSSPPAREGYEPPAGHAARRCVRDPREAAAGADVLVTDIWVSLGQEETRRSGVRDLEPYRLDESLLALAASERDRAPLPSRPIPARRSRTSVLYGEQSAVWDEAENRLHVQKALLALLLG